MVKKTTKKVAKKGAPKLGKYTRKIIDNFESISAVPRQSKKEEKIRAYLLDWAKKLNLRAKEDEVGNILVKVPASKGQEKQDSVVIQGHMDMVCEKTPKSKHDFEKDPIKLVYDGDWLKANQTTLGADNGIAIAIAMTIAEDKKLTHPPLELLFTVDEETGLTGAKALKKGFFKGKTLINIDSEDEGVFTVGCAGGKDTHIEYQLEYEEVPEGYIPVLLKASSMTGGHSGVNINEERANAIKILVRAIYSLNSLSDVRIIGIKGGTAHNAIPRDAEASLYLPADAFKEAKKQVSALQKVFKNEFANTDPKLKLSLKEYSEVTDNRAMKSYVTARVVDLIRAMPHGVAARSTDMPGLIETSSNLAKVWISEGKLYIETSQRSSVMSRLDGITQRVEAIARLAGASVFSGNGYPSWQPNFKSKLLDKCKKIYKKTFNEEAKVEAIHAGLECGLIGNVQSGMDMISFGPTIKNPHSPDEKIYIPSIEKIWKFTTELIKTM